MALLGSFILGTDILGENALYPSPTLYPSGTLYPGYTTTAAPGEGPGLYLVTSERPPLELHAEVEMPDGSRVNWRSSSTDPGSRPQDISFRTARYDGFKDGGCTLPRRIDRDYQDLRLFNMLRFIGAGGDVAYEGQMSGLPRQTGNPPSWSVQAAGLMATARERKFAMPFVDRDFGSWTDASVARKGALLAVPASINDVTWAIGPGGFTTAFPNQALPAQTVGEITYVMPTGETVDVVEYQGLSTNTPAGWSYKITASDNQDMSAGESYTITLDNVARSVTLTTNRRFLGLMVDSNGNAATPAVGSGAQIPRIAVYGNTGVAKHPINGELDGVYVSDVMRWIIENYCPELNANGVTDTTYAVAQVSMRDRVFPYDAFLLLNSFHRWGLECWEGGTVNYASLDLTDYDWELRLDDFGTGLQVNGPVAEEVANGIEVTYTDALTGHTETLLPDDYTELRDTNPLNAVNRAGKSKFTDVSITTPMIQPDALQIGRATLAEFNAPKHKGTATVQGYIRDRQGNPQPVWKARAGERVLITDSVDEDIHVIAETDYAHSNNTNALAIDDSFAATRIDAYLDRYSNVAQAEGLG